jgi:hypothetical protein
MTTINAEEVLRRLSARLKMRHLILLLNIRQYGSLTRVAEQMASSQPAITSALAELESMFGGCCSIARCAAWPHCAGQAGAGPCPGDDSRPGPLVRDMESTVAGFDAHLHVGVIPFISGRLLSAAIRRAMPEDSKG